MKYVKPSNETDPNAAYKDFNLETGEAGSIPPAAAIEAPMREIVNLIEAAGLTPSETDLTQMAQAIDAKINASTSNISNMVTTDTDQTISGNKTFTSNVNISGDNLEVVFHTSGDFTVNPSAKVVYAPFVAYDANNKRGGFVSSDYNTDGSNYTYLAAGTYKTDGSQIVASLAVRASRDGSVSATAPAPAISSNNTQIATTAYVNTKHQLVSALPASPNANVFYYISE